MVSLLHRATITSLWVVIEYSSDWSLFSVLWHCSFVHQEEHLDCKKLNDEMKVWWCVWSDLCMVQLMLLPPHRLLPIDWFGVFCYWWHNITHTHTHTTFWYTFSRRIWVRRLPRGFFTPREELESRIYGYIIHWVSLSGTSLPRLS